MARELESPPLLLQHGEAIPNNYKPKVAFYIILIGIGIGIGLIASIVWIELNGDQPATIAIQETMKGIFLEITYF